MTTLTTRDYIQLLGPATTLIGVGLSVVGAYFATTWFQLMSLGDFLISCFKGVGLMMIGRKDRAFAVAIKLARHKPENRGRTITGVYFLFIGFVLQAIGALFWGADMIWGILNPCVCQK